jgi:hypothetical protein
MRVLLLSMCFSVAASTPLPLPVVDWKPVCRIAPKQFH